MNQEYFASETQLNPDEVFFESRHSPNQSDAETYFGGASIRLKKRNPKSLWEDRVAEACGWPPRRLLSCLGDDEPEAVLEKIGEILERPIRCLTEEEISFRDIKYVCYELRERYWEEDLLDSFPGGISPVTGERNLRGCLYTTSGAKDIVIQILD